MSEPRLIIERLGSHHNRAAFSCGVEALDRYLRHQARQDVKRKASSTYVLNDRTAGLIVGYYTLSALSISPDRLPTTPTKKLPRYDEIPAMLIGRLAVDDRYRRQRMGQRLLLDALRRVFEWSDQFCLIVAIVDAKDDGARGFYDRFGFEPVLDNDYRLCIPVTSIGNLLGSSA